MFTLVKGKLQRTRIRRAQKELNVDVNGLVISHHLTFRHCSILLGTLHLGVLIWSK